MKCAYCGKAIKKADQRNRAPYQIGMGHMHLACRALYLAGRMEENVREYDRSRYDRPQSPA